jgi:hypothetical protein
MIAVSWQTWYFVKKKLGGGGIFHLFIFIQNIYFLSINPLKTTSLFICLVKNIQMVMNKSNYDEIIGKSELKMIF